MNALSKELGLLCAERLLKLLVKQDRIIMRFLFGITKKVVCRIPTDNEVEQLAGEEAPPTLEN